MMPEVTFPPGFLWGAATSSYQVEGYPLADGAGESIWHRFCRQPGRIQDGDTGDLACGHYRLWAQDVGLMRELGLKAYRFSIAWPRLFPLGGGPLNRRGLNFYERLVDALLEAGIEPAATLYHWDLPAALQDRGGWPSRDTARRFADYAAVVVGNLGDRVRLWMTLNEPQVAAMMGHLTGEHAPGERDPGRATAAAHHLLLAHGLAVPVMREAARRPLQIGIALNLWPSHPASDSEADAAAARRAEEANLGWYLDPLFLGGYPEEIVHRLGDAGPPVREGDLDTIRAPIDFLGVNYYSRSVVRHAPGSIPLEIENLDTGGPKTAMKWEIYPAGLYEILMHVHEKYAPGALYVTENGAAFDDQRGEDGTIEDAPRIDYLEAHFREARRAIDAGAPLRGYFVWSFLDNFEWAFGYSKRFGLVHVDFESLRRIVKGSGRWYARVIRDNGF